MSRESENLQAPLTDQPPDPAAAAALARETQRLASASRGIAMMVLGLAWVLGFGLLWVFFEYPTQRWHNLYICLVLGGLLLSFGINRLVRRHRLARGMLVVSPVDAHRGRLNKWMTVILIACLLLLLPIALFLPSQDGGHGPPTEDFPSRLKYGFAVIFAALAVVSLARYRRRRSPLSLIAAACGFAMGGLLVAYPAIRMDLLMAIFCVPGIVVGAVLHWQWRRWARAQEAAGHVEAQA